MIPTAAHTKMFTAIKKAMMATAAKGSLLRKGTRAWYPDALFETNFKREGVPSSVSGATSNDGRAVGGR
jgi:hypothetical protein